MRAVTSTKGRIASSPRVIVNSSPGSASAVQPASARATQSAEPRVVMAGAPPPPRSIRSLRATPQGSESAPTGVETRTADTRSVDRRISGRATSSPTCDQAILRSAVV